MDFELDGGTVGSSDVREAVRRIECMMSESNEEKWSSLIRAIHSSSSVARPGLRSPVFSTSISGMEKV